MSNGLFHLGKSNIYVLIGIWFNNYLLQKIKNIYPLGVSVNITSAKDSEEMENLQRMKQYGVHKITEVINSHQGNAM